MSHYNICNFQDFVNEKWNWKKIGAVGAVSATVILNSFLHKHKELSTKDVENIFKNQPIIQDSLIKVAKEEVKNKVLNSPYIKNKDSVIYYIDNIKFIETPPIMGEINPGYLNAKDSGLNIECILVDKSHLDDVANSNGTKDDYKLRAYTHELFHLVDKHKIVNVKPDVFVDIIDSISYRSLLSDIFDNEENPDKYMKTIFKIGYDKKVKYLSDKKEIYARLNNLKMFLYDEGYIKSPDNDISKKLFIDIFNGTFYKNLNDHQKDIFYSSDFLEILPFLYNADVQEINKLVYKDNDIHNNIS